MERTRALDDPPACQHPAEARQHVGPEEMGVDDVEATISGQPGDLAHRPPEDAGADPARPERKAGAVSPTPCRCELGRQRTGMIEGAYLNFDTEPPELEGDPGNVDL